jgi:release factor glutamine methyltransferase
VARRAKYEPLAYILGHQEFFGLDFIVDRRVLIPRHETETLVQLALERARKIASPVIVDVGTGSGAIGLSLAKNLPQARVVAVDQSHDALDVARLNAKRLGLESQVEFLHGDLLAPFVGSFDILVSNLPYIPTTRIDELPHEVRAFEPRLALDGGPDGLDVMRRLLVQLESHANRNAVGLLEISEEQGKLTMETIYRAMPNAVVTVHPDLEGLDRVVEIQIKVID